MTRALTALISGYRSLTVVYRGPPRIWPNPGFSGFSGFSRFSRFSQFLEKLFAQKNSRRTRKSWWTPGAPRSSGDFLNLRYVRMAHPVQVYGFSRPIRWPFLTPPAKVISFIGFYLFHLYFRALQAGVGPPGAPPRNVWGELSDTGIYVATPSPSLLHCLEVPWHSSPLSSPHLHSRFW